MPEPTRQYIFTEEQIRFAFIASGIGMVSILVLLLVLVSARPQGRYAPADTTQFQNTLELAIQDLEGYEVLENGRATIDIRHAMELVAERGVALELTSAADDPGTTGGTEAADDGDVDDAEAGAGADGAAQADALPDGSQVYAQCAGCHQATGQGVPGAFPPLAGHAPRLYGAEGGREYLVNVVLYGLQGPIQVEGQTYNGVMPAWPQLSDAEVAAVLNHILTAWDDEGAIPDFEPYAPEDVEAQRGLELSTSAVLDQRNELDLP